METSEFTTDPREAVMQVLPGNVKELVGKIEDFAKKPIRFEHRENSEGPIFSAPYCEVSAQGPMISITRDWPITAHGITHELLHIERYWVQNVPQIVPVRNEKANWSVTSSIENALEHLIVVPGELQYGFEEQSSAFWKKTLIDKWSGYPWPDSTSPWARRMNFMLGSLALDIPSSPEAKRLITDCLLDAGMYAETEKFRKLVGRLIVNDKAQALGLVVKFIGINKDDARLRYANALTGTETHAPLI